MSQRFGIIGYGKVGKIHVRIFNKLGCKTDIILVDKNTNIAKIVEHFEHHYNYSPLITRDPRIFFHRKLNFVVLSSPTPTHFKYLKMCCDYKLKVLCEKPLFWMGSLTEFEKKITQISSNNARFLVNTSNALLVKAFKKKYLPKEINNFSFTFHTNGKNKYEAISVDLLPHGIAMMTELFGYNLKITNIVKEIDNQSNKINFNYGNKSVEFRFRECPVSTKKMLLEFNGKVFERKTIGSGETYRVSFIDSLQNVIFEIQDPFKTYAIKFLKDSYQMDKDFQNLRLTSEVLLNGD